MGLILKPSPLARVAYLVDGRVHHDDVYKQHNDLTHALLPFFHEPESSIATPAYKGEKE